MSTIGDRLRELRGASSQREMAEAIGIKQNAWARYESGGALPGAEILATICRVHACSADWLLGLERHGATPVVKVNGNDNVVAAGTGAKAAKTVTSAVQAACKACPYKKALAKLQNDMLQIPGL